MDMATLFLMLVSKITITDLEFNDTFEKILLRL